jgi:uncharacterized protein (UPF0276 family)
VIRYHDSSPIPAQAGIGLRFPHHASAVSGDADAAWFEVHPENYMADAGALGQLRQVRERRPLSLHAVGLSLGSVNGINQHHLARLQTLVRELRPGLVSDHLSWSLVPGRFLPDLLPLPYTEEALAVVCRNVAQVQDSLSRQLLVENPSTYLRFAAAQLSEAEFLAELARRTGCGVLLDINNIYVSACNHRESPQALLDGFLDALPDRTVGELHLAGHAVVNDEAGRELRIDDHGSVVSEAVWRLYERALQRLGPRPTLIEWDTRIPEFSVLEQQAAAAQLLIDRCSNDYAVAV